MSVIASIPFMERSVVLSRQCNQAIWLCFVLSSSALGQDLNKAGWLPKTLTEPYSESLLITSKYIVSREGCDRLLEAKLSESSNPENPKFIFTCANRRNATANFVYWQSDVEAGFVGDSYPEKSLDPNSTETLSEHEAKLRLRRDNADLVSDCKAHLQELLGARPVLMSESNIDVSQRGEQPVVVNFDYQVGEGDYAPKFSSICRRDSFSAINLRIFPKQ